MDGWMDRAPSIGSRTVKTISNLNRKTFMWEDEDYDEDDEEFDLPQEHTEMWLGWSEEHETNRRMALCDGKQVVFLERMRFVLAMEGSVSGEEFDVLCVGWMHKLWSWNRLSNELKKIKQSKEQP